MCACKKTLQQKSIYYITAVDSKTNINHYVHVSVEHKH